MTTDSQTATEVDTTEEPSTIEFDKSASAELHEVLLKVGPGGVHRQRFLGRQLGESREFTKAGFEVIRVYLSRKGKYVVHRQRCDWADFALATNWAKEWKNWREIFDIDDQTWAEYTVEIIDTLAELGERIPARIYRGLVDVTTAHPQTEDLDI